MNYTEFREKLHGVEKFNSIDWVYTGDYFDPDTAGVTFNVNDGEEFVIECDPKLRLGIQFGTVNELYLNRMLDLCMVQLGIEYPYVEDYKLFDKVNYVRAQLNAASS